MSVDSGGEIYTIAGHRSEVYHTDPDCTALKGTWREPRTVSPDTVGDRALCKYCAGDVPRKNGGGGPWSCTCGASRDPEDCEFCAVFDAVHDVPEDAEFCPTDARPEGDSLHAIGARLAPGFITFAEQEVRTHVAETETNTCSRCGGPWKHTGICQGCRDRGDLVDDPFSPTRGGR